jgi:structural maintenance of chromosome 2
LVYKRGQAGITKASVTVVFNNSNPAQSPVGYADCSQVTVTRQIVLNGKNKYLINGHNAQQKAVENLFQSVQLNVNNPHFLIMQGQITRVLNMKPEEILAMVEESAGTRMFEDRKLKAISTMEKKEKKVDEIAALLTDTIDPKLDALRSERSEFLEFKRTEADLERLQRLLKAYEYCKNSKVVERERERLTELQDDLTFVKEQARVSLLELEKVQDNILNVTKRRQLESKASAKMKELEEACKEMAANMVRLQTQITFKRDALLSEEGNVASLSASLEGERVKVSKLEGSLEKVQDRFGVAEERRVKLQSELRRDEDLLRSLETGLGGGDSAEIGYAKLLREARDQSSQAETALQQAQNKAATLRKELAAMETQVQRAKKEGKLSTDRINNLQAEIDSMIITKHSQPTGSKDEDNLMQLHEEKSQLEGSIGTLKEELDNLQSAVSSVEFRYSIPDGSFDQKKVKGVVAELIKLDTETLPFATALEVCAGGRLYNVVVADEGTATALLDKGKLTRRVTIIPLNKIQSRPIAADKATLASQASKGQAMVGLSLVGFDADVKSAMEYVFGGTFVCANKEAATMMAFDKRFGQRAVTIQGDVYEPSGTLSGGAAPTTGGILERLYNYRLASAELEKLQQRLADITGRIAALESARRGLAERERLLRTKQQELSSLQRQFALADAGQILERHAQVAIELEALEKEMKKQEQIRVAAEQECARYAREAAELSTDREGKLASLAKQISAAKAKLTKDEAAYKKVSEEYGLLKNELVASTAVIAELENQRQVVQEAVVSLDSEISQLQEENLQSITRHSGLRIKLDAEMRHLRKYDEELAVLDGQKRSLEEAIEATALEKTKAMDSIAATEKTLRRAEDLEKGLLATNPWIRDTRSQFGIVGTPYDFSTVNMTEIAAKLRGLEAQRENLRKTINFNVMDMIDRVESKEKDLKQMLSTVKKDRGKIEGTITRLNDYMLEALQKTFSTVNRYL